MKANCVIVLSVGLTLLVSISGCQANYSAQQDTNFDTSNTVGAIYFSPQHEPGQPISGEGSIALFDINGDVTTKQLGEVERGSLSWNNNGILFYIDNEYDYYTSNSTTDKIKATRETSYTDSLTPITDNDFLGIYNKGFSNNSYVEPVSIHSKNNQTNGIFDHSIWSTTACGSNVYAFKLLEEGSPEIDKYSNYALNSIFVNGEINFNQTLFHPKHLPSLLFPTGSVPCQDNKAYMITNQFSEQPISSEQIETVLLHNEFKIEDENNRTHFANSSDIDGTTISTLDIWDLNSSSVFSIPLLDDNQEPLHIPNDQLSNSLIHSNSLSGDYLYWIMNQDLAKTNIHNGTTHFIHNVLDTDQNESYTFMDIINDHIYVFQAPINEPSNISVRTINLKNYSEQETIKLKIDSKISSDKKITGFGINPVDG